MFGVGAPLLIAVLLWVNVAHYIVLAGLLWTIQILGFAELEQILVKAGLPAPGKGSLILAVLSSFAVYVASFFNVPHLAVLALTWSLLTLLSLAPLTLAEEADFPKLAAAGASRLLVLFYIGLLPSFLMLIVTSLPDARGAVATFALATFGNDSLAWLAGMTLGRKRGILKVSPKKSLAGFIGGTLGSVLAMALGTGLLAVRPPSWDLFSFLAFSVVSGLCMSFFVVVGDLFESALKRSAAIKDSGTIVPGRGGVLDSFDSLLYSGPCFVALVMLFRLFGA